MSSKPGTSLVYKAISRLATVQSETLSQEREGGVGGVILESVKYLMST